MGERWINAVIEVVSPLDVPVDAPESDKERALERELERLNLPADVAAGARWELVEDGEPV